MTTTAWTTAAHAWLVGAMWLLITVAVYFAARALYGRFRLALLNPALVAILALIALLRVTGTRYDDYSRGAGILTLLLGPAVVALGVRLAEQLPLVRQHARDLLLTIAAASLAGMLAAVGVAALFRTSLPVIRSLAPRSATTPIAMAIAARVGGIPALSAAVSIASGLLGGAIGPELLYRLGVRAPLAHGIALGAAAHGLGTARAIEEGPLEGAASGMAMALNGVATALLAPLVLAALGYLLGWPG